MFHSQEIQKAYNIIAILTRRLGGEVTITDTELLIAPVATVDVGVDSIKLTVGK